MLSRAQVETPPATMGVKLDDLVGPFQFYDSTIKLIGWFSCLLLFPSTQIPAAQACKPHTKYDKLPPPS